MSTQLQQLDIEITEGFNSNQIELEPDMFIIGNVVARDNPLLESILNKNLIYKSGPQWLYENILYDKWVLGVAGTHGKTTTSAMLAWILEANDLAPGFLIGGIPNNFNVSARLPINTKKNSPTFFVILNLLTGRVVVTPIPVVPIFLGVTIPVREPETYTI